MPVPVTAVGKLKISFWAGRFNCSDGDTLEGFFLIVNKEIPEEKTIPGSLDDVSLLFLFHYCNI